MAGLGTKNRRKLMKSDDDTVGDIFSIVTKYCIREQENIIIQERLIYKLGVIETL